AGISERIPGSRQSSSATSCAESGAITEVEQVTPSFAYCETAGPGVGVGEGVAVGVPVGVDVAVGVGVTVSPLPVLTPHPDINRSRTAQEIFRMWAIRASNPC